MSRAALATQGNALISALEKQRQTAQFEANNNTAELSQNKTQMT
jgi:hypothetical protein